ncbi:hypothetical protein MSG28_011710 [Choristoneura fumiferana]|uniref:Uncharacterized protein n=1 Tax=Choristoneura fumiferana TaxID=7141 RepID=A0ACC0KMK3_CHOFU|nr:hypothetical protein MSG28_011710 [Choristoneura fumiferana]
MQEQSVVQYGVRGSRLLLAPRHSICVLNSVVVRVLSSPPYVRTNGTILFTEEALSEDLTDRQRQRREDRERFIPRTFPADRALEVSAGRAAAALGARDGAGPVLGRATSLRTFLLSIQYSSQSLVRTFLCEDNVILHKFPNPEKDLTRFHAWTFAIGGNILLLDDMYVFKYRRVCHVHFEDKYYLGSKMLTNIAVPTMHLKVNVYRRRRGPLRSLVSTPRPARPAGTGAVENKENTNQPNTQTAVNAGASTSDQGLLPDECKHTADFILFMDSLFDSLNGSFTNSAKRSGKPLLQALTPSYLIMYSVVLGGSRGRRCRGATPLPAAPAAADALQCAREDRDRLIRDLNRR